MRGRLDHVSVSVANLDRSLAFYRDLLGLGVLGSGEEGTEVAALSGVQSARFRYADLDLGNGQILELLQYLAPVGTPKKSEVYDPGSGHLAIRVDDLEVALDRLRAAGVMPRSKPIVLEEPSWWAGARCVYVADPDGVTVELVERSSAPSRTGHRKASR